MYTGKKVAIAGFGAEGKSALDYYQNRGAEVTVLDDDKSKLSEVPPGVEFKDFSASIASLNKYDIVSRTPIIPPSKFTKAKLLTSVTIEFFNICPAPIIAVTGTKGKGTTATLIAKLLESQGYKVHLLGNIGLPALSVVDQIKPTDYVVYEISSFQLWDMQQSAPLTVVLMLEEDHLDIHESFNDYLQAKGNICRWQSDSEVCIHHPTNKNTLQIVADTKATKVPYFTKAGAHIRGDNIVINEQVIGSINQVGLIGQHNLENICAAVTTAYQVDQNISGFSEVITSFEGLEHRIERVATVDGKTFYNDSFSTAPIAAIAALNSFKTDAVIILGGYDKSADFSELAIAVRNNNPHGVLVIGETAEQISRNLDDHGYSNYQVTSSNNFDEIVRQAFEMAQAGDAVVLSPGCASFDMFDNYKQRGKVFKQAVSKLNE